MNQKALGRRIKQAREEKRMTQEQLAECVYVSPTHISVIERGVKAPSLETLIIIANTLDVSTDTLLQDTLKNCSTIVSTETAKWMQKLSCENLSGILYLIIRKIMPKRNIRKRQN